jgi:hypothetical protein
MRISITAVAVLLAISAILAFAFEIQPAFKIFGLLLVLIIIIFMAFLGLGFLNLITKPGLQKQEHFKNRNGL